MKFATRIYIVPTTPWLCCYITLGSQKSNFV